MGQTGGLCVDILHAIKLVMEYMEGNGNVITPVEVFDLSPILKVTAIQINFPI